MQTYFLGREYVALSLIKAKHQIFHENFITTSELNQYIHFLQSEFNNQGLDIIITSNPLSRTDFIQIDDVIMTSNTCSLNLNLLRVNILTILYDSKLILDFFIKLENEKLEILEKSKNEDLKLCKKI